MRDDVIINAWWDQEASVWIATGEDVPGLIVETGSWSEMVSEVPVVVDDLLEVSGERARPGRFTFEAEQRPERAAA